MPATRNKVGTSPSTRDSFYGFLLHTVPVIQATAACGKGQNGASVIHSHISPCRQVS
jgi:hypothetical protein